VRLFDESGSRTVTPPLHDCLVEGRTVQPDRYDLLRNERGIEHAIRWSASPIHDASGAVAGMVFAFSDLTQMLALSREMVRQATHDALTGLPNRVLLEDRLENALARARRGRGGGGHVHRPGRVQEGQRRLRHAAGDALLGGGGPLKAAAARRTASAAGARRVRRPAGEAGGPRCGDGKGSEAAAAAALPLRVLEQEVYVTASIGISLFPRDADDVGGLFKRADAAMNHAKQDGSNNFKFYSRQMNDQAVERLALEKALWNALPDGELILHYQPQVELRAGASRAWKR
jgi:predicted signal transduction protein with EAL and GGDEF domain